MRSALALVPEAGLGTNTDLTRYFLVCAGSILALVVLGWIFRRTLAQHVKRRAARRSLQVLDVLPLSGKQKLVVVRCYDRSFLLALGDKEVRSIAELELEPAAPPDPGPAHPGRPGFAASLKRALASQDPGLLSPQPESGATPRERSLNPGVLA